MLAPDFIRLSLQSVLSQRSRSLLTALGIAVGIAAVVLLTSIGEGVHRFVLAEFSQFGTNLLGITPGKITTTGITGSIVSTVRPLSIEDSEALRRVPKVLDVVPVVQGNAPVEGGDRQRRTAIFGVGPAAPRVWSIKVAVGRFLPDDDPRAARAFAVLGSKLRNELFGQANPLGERIRIGGESYRVVGVMESKGQLLGFDLDDSVYIPAARALAMFNRDSLMEIDILYHPEAMADRVAEAASNLLIGRHGSEDFTIVTQEQMLSVLGDILQILTLAVAALGGISLLVGGVGIVTIMIIAVTERTQEIGLLRALGAGRGQVMSLFLGEAVALAFAGGLFGLLLGMSGAGLLALLVPGLPVQVSWFYVLLAEVLAVIVGLVAGVIPARRAAAMDPIEALRTE